MSRRESIGKIQGAFQEGCDSSKVRYSREFMYTMLNIVETRRCNERFGGNVQVIMDQSVQSAEMDKLPSNQLFGNEIVPLPVRKRTTKSTTQRANIRTVP